MNLFKANIWKIFLAFLVLLPLVLLLAWFLQDIAKSLVVIPISYVLWLFDRLLESTPQFLIWLVLIVVMGILVGKSLTTRSTTFNEPPPPDQNYLRRSRLRYWGTQLNQQSDFSRSRLVDSVDRLVLEVITYSHRMPTWQAEKRLIEGDIQAPDELVKFLRIRKQSPNYRPSSPLLFFKNLMSFLKNRLMKSPDFITTKDKNRELGIILDYLEDQLEIHHDHSHS